MKVTLEYFGMLREAAGLNQEDLELPGGADGQALVQSAAERHGEPLRSLLLSAEGVPHPWLLIAIDDVVAVRVAILVVVQPVVADLWRPWVGCGAGIVAIGARIVGRGCCAIAPPMNENPVAKNNRVRTTNLIVMRI